MTKNLKRKNQVQKKIQKDKKFNIKVHWDNEALILENGAIIGYIINNPIKHYASNIPGVMGMCTTGFSGYDAYVSNINKKDGKFHLGKYGNLEEAKQHINKYYGYYND